MSTLNTSAKELLVYFGTTNEKNSSKGIYVSRFDTETGRLTPAVLAAPIESPMFLSLHPTKNVLYAVGEKAAPKGKTLGYLASYTIDFTSGKLTPLNTQPSKGDALCYVQIDATGRAALAASYRDGTVMAFPLHDDGSLKEVVSIVRHSGSSVHPRQKAPHAHCIDLDPANRYALVADLGTDQVITYTLNQETPVLAPHARSFHSKPGAGPRHIAFSRDARQAYIINELDSTLTVANYNAETGALEEQQSLPLLPSYFKGQSTAAEVAVHPSGRFVYASNRGFDSIAVFERALGTGRLTFRSFATEGFSHPRHFTIDSTGRWLLCANRDTNTVTVYAIDSGSGQLKLVYTLTDVAMPTCVTLATPDVAKP
ncbi:MAG: lactonase family protein [Nibricoccus sp.]